MLDIWPALPIVVRHHYFRKHKLDNLIAAIEHNDRVCEIDFHSFFDLWQLQRIMSVMQVPFPALKNLKLSWGDHEPYGDEPVLPPVFPVLPDLFLGRSAPRLQHLKLDGFSFPGLPDLLLSATGLVSLEILRIPHSWYISSHAMAIHLSALTRLESLTLGFEFCRSRPDPESPHSPPPTRTLIPALTRLKFEGAKKYAEDFVTQVDTPRLDNLNVTFFNETVSDISHLSQFISRHVKFQTPNEARVSFTDDHITVTLSFPMPGHERLAFGILWDESAGHLSSLVQLCSSFFPGFAMVERLYICHYGYTSWRRHWEYRIEYSHWLQLLHLFTGAKDLYISKELTTSILSVLESLVGERTPEVLPALQNIFCDKNMTPSNPTAIEDLIDAREASGYPIFVSRWSGLY